MQAASLGQFLICGVIGLALPAFAANRVGDADNSGSLSTADAALVQSRLYGEVMASQVSPLALVDGDGDLDLADMVLLAQAAAGSRTIDNPALALDFSPPSPIATVTGGAVFVESFAIASMLPAVAGLVDG